VLKGTVVSGFNGVTGAPSETPISLEIRILLPRGYLRIEQDSAILRRSGFFGTTLLNQWKPLVPNAQVSTSFSAEQINIEQRACAQLVLGMLAETATAFPLEVGQDPQPSEHSVRLDGPGGSTVIMDLDETSHLPLRVRFESAVRFPRAITAEEKRAGVVPPPPKPENAEVVLAFQNRRLVDGVALASEVVRTARDIRFERMRFDSIVVNPALSPDDFK
jgi:hypothetical protein